MFDPTSMILAEKVIQRELGSARPNAPVIPQRSRRRLRTHAGRTLLADLLRRLANRVEPRPVQTCKAAS